MNTRLRYIIGVIVVIGYVFFLTGALRGIYTQVQETLSLINLDTTLNNIVFMVVAFFVTFSLTVFLTVTESKEDDLEQTPVQQDVK